MSYQAIRIRSSFSGQGEGQSSRSKNSASRSGSFTANKDPAVPPVTLLSIESNVTNLSRDRGSVRTTRSRANSVINKSTWTPPNDQQDLITITTGNGNEADPNDNKESMNSIKNHIYTIKSLVDSFESTLSKDWKQIWLDPGISIRHFDSVKRELRSLEGEIKKYGPLHYYGDAKMISQVMSPTSKETRITGGGYLALERIQGDEGIMSALSSDSGLLANRSQRKRGAGTGGLFAPFSSSFQPTLVALERYIVIMPSLAPYFHKTTASDLMATNQSQPQASSFPNIYYSQTELNQRSLASSAASSSPFLFLSRSFSGTLSTSLGKELKSQSNLNNVKRKKKDYVGGGQTSHQFEPLSSLPSVSGGTSHNRRSETPISTIGIKTIGSIAKHE